jgi:hypothetical protein
MHDDEWDDDDWFGNDEDDDDLGLTPEEHVEALVRICDDAEARRELLWLRAMEKDDEESARDLERIDPGLLARMMPLVEEYLERGNELDGWRERREGYGQLHDERFRYHALRLGCGREARRD